MSKSIIKDNLESVRERAAAAALRAGRDPSSVRLVAVSKMVPWTDVREAARCGQLIFGENYVQEARDKIPALYPGLTWHFIGYLQSKKARLAAELFQVIESVDRLKLALTLERHLASMNRQLSVFVQVNIGKEPQKAGVLPDRAEELLEQVAACPHLRLSGLMAIPPVVAGPDAARPYFRELRDMAERFQAGGLLGQNGPVELSMGMSGDFEAAIEEGATIIRLGTALFGPRC